ncbi:MAG: energy-coupling factor ABC transporter ATP-binding protein [Methanomicrobiales archaeon]|nr:energy-coupling factor ABC transporter ATP-binding protein [Methanomicrobiales archaeon]
MITIRGLSHGILEIPDLLIPAGRVAVIGPNGGGKTTLLRLLAGIDLPEKGEILIDGLPPRSREVGWVGEQPEREIIFHRVEDEMASALRFRHDPCPLVDERVKAIAGELGIGRLLGRETGGLSAGEKAMVALGAAAIAGAGILVLDETDSHLDQESAGTVQSLIRGMSVPHILQATQRMELAAGSDHVLFLDGGRVIHSGSPAAVFAALSGTPFSPPSRGCI